jgi:hypothetical protein
MTEYTVTRVASGRWLGRAFNPISDRVERKTFDKKIDARRWVENRRLVASSGALGTAGSRGQGGTHHPDPEPRTNGEAA